MHLPANLMRLGFFGGTFNPVHLGHLHLAETALHALSLDHLYWLPANPWQKDPKDILPAQERATMVELAIKNIDRMSVDRLEIDNDCPSFSIDTVKTLACRYPDDERFYLMGEDQWANFHTWRHWQDIFDFVTLVVFRRENKDFKTEDAVDQFIKEHHKKVLFLDLDAVPISSSTLRAALARNGVTDLNTAQWLPADVAKYLMDHPSLLGRLRENREQAKDC